MRVLHVYKDYWPVVGGIENHVRRLATGFQRFPEVEVDVLVTARSRRTSHELIDGVPVTKAGRIATLASAPISPALFWEIGLRSYDITHLHFPYPIGELAFLLRGRSRRLVVTYHSDIVRQRRLGAIYRPFLNLLLSRADAICVSNPRYAAGSPILPKFSGKIRVIHHGLDLARFEQTPQVERRATEIRASLRPPITLFVGELRYYKGVDVLIRAMSGVAGQLVVVGGGPEEPNLRAVASRTGVADRIVFSGRVSDDDLVAYYRAADVFVLPSTLRAESWGAVLLEAMASRLPLVTTEIGTGTSYVNLAGETGLVVPPNEPGALAKAIGLLQASPELRNHLGEGALHRVHTEMTVERMVDDTKQLYESLF